MKFVDEADIVVVSGKGGDGCNSFQKDRNNPKGRPDGGDGGHGGDVVLVADGQLATLLDFKYRHIYKAERGRHGRGKGMHGRCADASRLRVPVGTIVRDAETGEIIGDLVVDGQEVTVARGGRGGRGNPRFATREERRVEDRDRGEEGVERKLSFELKLLADVGLLGLPNAGKSTLIARVSQARPRIADYPFTTLTPNLGAVAMPDFMSFVMADIPGIIEGAHLGSGLGHRFLRHIERASILIYLIDPVDPTQDDPLKTFDILRNEIVSYNASMSEKSALIVINKIDLPAARDALQEYGGRLNRLGATVYPISAATGEGIDVLLAALVEMVRKSQKDGKDPSSDEAEGIRQTGLTGDEP